MWTAWKVRTTALMTNSKHDLCNAMHMMRVAIVLASDCTAEGLRVGARKVTTLVDITCNDEGIEMPVKRTTAVGRRKRGDAWN